VLTLPFLDTIVGQYNNLMANVDPARSCIQFCKACKIVIASHQLLFIYYLYYHRPTDSQLPGRILKEMEIICRWWCVKFIVERARNLGWETQASCNSLYVSRHHSVTCLLRSTISTSIMEMYELVWACASHMHPTNHLRLDILHRWARFARTTWNDDKLVEILNKLPDIHEDSRSPPDFSPESDTVVGIIKASTERWEVKHRLGECTVKFLENPRDPSIYVQLLSPC
jgi:hypothetical protein